MEAPPTFGEIDQNSFRLDLDDLGGKIVVLDWERQTHQSSPVSWQNHHLEEQKLMNGRLSVILHQESKDTKMDPDLHHRMMQLSGNALVQPLQKISDDPVLADIQDIPRICSTIQDDWHSQELQ